MATIRLTVAQAVVRFLAQQYSERDGHQQRLIPGCFGIFGHGNVAGVGQALLQAATTGEADLPYYLARNEQGTHFDLRRRHASPRAQRVMDVVPQRARSWSRWTIDVSDADRRALAAVYRPEVARLEEMVGRAMPWDLG